MKGILKPSLSGTTNVFRRGDRPTIQIESPLTEIAQLFRQEFVLTKHSIQDLLIAHMLTTALSKYEQQGASFLNSQAYGLLSDPNLKIIELWAQASICPKCPNFEHIIATYPFRESKCLNCGQDNLTVRIYVLNENYERHKTKNKDLPLYICKLINREIKGSAVASQPISKSTPNRDGDIDVWIQSTLTGIECKLRLPQPKYADSQLQSYCDEIIKDLEKYIQFGAKHLVVVTSCDEDDASKLHQLFHDLIGGKCESLRVVHKSVFDLVSMVSEQTEKIRRATRQQ